ncbi:MAG: insulinase family protein, partial [Prevotella sp.]|nr:insulinase family protein [Prevotella sp.]
VLNCLERVGGELNAYTTKQRTTYYCAILKDHVAKAVDLLTDIVFHSTYPQSEIDKEVEVICDEIDSYYDSPAELIYDEFENIAFHDHPLGHNILGTSERVRSFTTEDALRFTRKFYRPENAIFFSYGDADFKRLVKLLETRNRDVARGEVILERTLHAPTPPLAQTTIREMHTHQAHVMMGCLAYDIHHDYRIPLYLLNNILGGPNMNAKLNLALRERRGLVYTVESMATYYSDTGLWSVYFGCDPHDVEKCCKLVRKELNLVKKKVMSDVQLKAAQQQIKGQIGVACDHRLQFALDFGKNFLLYGWEKDINSLFQQIDNVTAEDIIEVANELFQEEKLMTLIIR